MQGRIDTSFTTEQRDLFASGTVAEIGVTAYAVWQAIKFYADYNTGKAFPGMRTLAAKLGVGTATIKRSIDTLIAAKLLRLVDKSSVQGRKGHTYIARERMRVTIGARTICTVIVDYIPATIRHRLTELHAHLNQDTDAAEWADVEIIPGPGFAWDQDAGLLRGSLHASELPKPPSDEYHARLVKHHLPALLAAVKK